MPSLKNPANGSSLRTPEQQTHAAVLEIYGSGFLWNRGDFANLAETFEGALIVDTGAVSDSSTSSSAPCHSLRVSAGKKRTPMLVIMTYGLRNLLPRSLRSPQKLSRTGLNTHQMPSATGFSDFLGLWYCSGNQFEAHLEIQSPRLPTGNMIEGILPVGSMSS